MGIRWEDEFSFEHTVVEMFLLDVEATLMEVIGAIWAEIDLICLTFSK